MTLTTTQEGTSTVFELEQRVRQLTLLQEAVRKINSTLQLDDLLNEIVVDLAEVFGCNRFKRGKEGMVGRVSVTGEPMYAPDVRKNQYYYHCESSTLSEVAIPLLCKGRLIGVMDAQSPRVNGFSQEQLQLLTAFADSIANAIENARLFRAEQLQKERMFREHDEARVIQSALLPSAHPTVPGYALEGNCLQVRSVGGDWYDYISLDPHRVGIVLGDVCGKGMAAALLMSATRSIVRRNIAAGGRPSDVLRRVNASLRDDFPPGRFVTLIYAVLDAKQHILSFANAGHLPPLLCRGDQWSSVKSDSGLPLGILDGDYSDSRIEMDRCSSVLLYTDGMVEATDPEGNEYGIGRLGSALTAPFPSARSLAADVVRYGGNRDLADDATVVLIQRTVE
jgi:sigma-B regulation protein RsbU (phosphoserine phosphatase)